MVFTSLFRPNTITFIKSAEYVLRRNNSNVWSYFHSEVFPSKSCLSHPKAVSGNIICLRYMAGHAKWQNIKHIKADKDREKSAMCSKYVRLIQFAVRESGSDPKNNQRLANLLDEARKNNVPKDTLESAMKRGSNKATKFGTLEILGPGGCMIIAEYETANESLTRASLKFICRKYGANILSGGGKWRAVYEKKGIITVIKELSGDPLNEAKALDSAIEAGAEEVQMKENEERKNFLEFVCSPDDIHQVKKDLERQYEVEEHYIAYIPMNTMQISDEDAVLVDGFLEELGNSTDVVRIYENVQ